MKLLQKISIPLFLLILALLTYALFFWERGFYWDEAPWTWVYYRLGPAALTRLFSTSRPFWGLIYQVMLPLIGPHPWAWQILMVLLRWLTAVLVWAIFRQVWPKNPRPALWTSALFLVYPGLGQNFIALMYTHFYIVFCVFLLSLYLSLLAIQRKSWPLHAAALVLSTVNLLTMEYFYFLEFFRIILFWHLLDGPLKTKIRRTILVYLSYLLTFLVVTFWRAFFFSNQNASYTYQTLDDLKANFFLGLGKLLLNIFRAFWETVPHAWFFPFEPVDLTTLGLYTAIGAFALALVSTLFVGLYLYPRDDDHSSLVPHYSLLILGLAAWILGGGAFWLVGERTLPQLHFSADRFTLSFILGSSLIVAALLGFLDRYPKVQYTLLALLVGFSVGKQFQTNALYRRDWDTQRALFWQMSWRMPELQPGTALLSNDLPVTLFSDNSLSGPLNWIYNSSQLGSAKSPDFAALDPGMNYILYFATVRSQEGRALGQGFAPNLPIVQNYLARIFYGNTSQMIVFNFSPPGCFRVLDPEIDPLNKLLPPVLREAAFLSNPDLIRSDHPVSLPDFYNPEIPQTWCYYFSKAELARQNGDWIGVLDFHRQALATGDRPNDPVENFVFIEGYAHVGKWDEARKLTKETYKFSKEVMRPMLCRLWQRIERESPASPEKQNAITGAFEDIGCSP
jgi:hypothetical protein